RENIVSAFSKLNPFIREQNAILDNLGEIETIGELVYFDQQMDDETQRSHFNRNTRQNLRKLRQVSSVIEGRSSQDIETFIQIYHATMDRLNAKKVFYFGHEYFKELMDSKLVDCKILFAVHNDTKDVIAAAFLTRSQEICQLELMGTNAEYFNLGP